MPLGLEYMVGLYTTSQNLCNTHCECTRSGPCCRDFPYRRLESRLRNGLRNNRFCALSCIYPEIVITRIASCHSRWLAVTVPPCCANTAADSAYDLLFSGRASCRDDSPS